MSEILIALTKAANHLAIKMRDKVSSKRLPQAISDAMSVGTAQYITDGVAQVEISIDLKKAPMAAAFEYGSGIHREQNPGLYPIEAVNVPNLVFWWEKGGKWFKGARLPYGHPGVAARPYIHPTVQEELPELRNIIGQSFRATIIAELKTTIMEG